MFRENFSFFKKFPKNGKTPMGNAAEKGQFLDFLFFVFFWLFKSISRIVEGLK
jgi:hypothetical protein